MDILKENKKVPTTDGFVDYHREVGINNRSTVWAAFVLIHLLRFLFSEGISEPICFFFDIENDINPYNGKENDHHGVQNRH